jgi:lipopolysaccharide/colanic/teichoic acid biosynthesis glycosyltransferase
MDPTILSRPTGAGNEKAAAESSFGITCRSRIYGALKPKIDFLIALAAFAIASPVMLLAGLLVKLTSHGPVIYLQTRVGRYGQLFSIYKIRTMVHNCEASSGVRWATKRDARVTFIGSILRKTHIDELPQLWNVLRGHMSLVGPRPERPEFVLFLRNAVDGYDGRLAVKPGMTGLAQIQLPPDTNIRSVRDKLALDLVYVNRGSMWLDVRLLIGTACYLMGFSFSTVRTLMRLPASAVVPSVKLQDDEIDFRGATITNASNDASLSGTRGEPRMSSI